MYGISPAFLFTLMWLLWLLLFIISPYTYKNIYPLLPAVSSLLLNIIFFYIGIFLSKYIYPSKNKILDINFLERKMKLHSKKIKRLFKISIILGLIGVIIKLYIRFYIQGFLNYDNITDFRFQLLDPDMASSASLGTISGLLYPFGVVALTLWIYFKEYLKTSRLVTLLVWFIGTYAAIDVILIGGRTTLVLIIILIFMTFKLKNLILKKKITILNRKNIMYIILFSIGLIYISSIIIFQRLDKFGMSAEDYLHYAEIGREISINKDFLIFIKSFDFFSFDKFLIALSEIIHYYIHGVFEYIRLFNFFNFENLWYGVHEYYIYFKFFDRLGWIDVSYIDTLKGYYKTGVYTTFFGPVLIDFGYFSFVYSLFFGLVSQLLYYKALAGRMIGMILYPYIVSVIVFGPIINIMMGSILYILNALVLSYLYFKVKN